VFDIKAFAEKQENKGAVSAGWENPGGEAREDKAERSTALQSGGQPPQGIRVDNGFHLAGAAPLRLCGRRNTMPSQRLPAEDSRAPRVASRRENMLPIRMKNILLARRHGATKNSRHFEYFALRAFVALCEIQSAFQTAKGTSSDT